MALFSNRWHIAGVLVILVIAAGFFQSAGLMVLLMWNALVILLVIKGLVWLVKSIRR